MMAIVAVMLTVANVCGASDGASLDKQQKVAENFISAIHRSDSSAHSKVVKTFGPSMDEFFNVEGFVKFQDNVRNRYGVLKSLKLRSYENDECGSIWMYEGQYSEKKVYILVEIDKNGKIAGGRFIGN